MIMRGTTEIACLLFSLFLYFASLQSETQVVDSNVERKMKRSRGIVIAMGPTKAHFAGAYGTIKSIREDHLCDLAIEIWAYKHEIDKFPPSVIESLETISNVTINALEYPVYTPPQWDSHEDWYRDYVGFSTMARAIWSSSLDEVIAVDVDTVLFSNPHQLFETVQYKQTGTLFLLDKFLNWWPHYYTPFDNQWIHQFIKSYDANFDHIPIKSTSKVRYFERKEFVAFVNSGSQHLAESSLVMFDKSRHQRTMAILEDITNRRGLDLYQNAYGDKESYWLACELARVPYAFNEWASSHWGLVSGSVKMKASYITGMVRHDNQQSSPTGVSCAGNAYQEPGAFHYFPGKEKIAMSFNGCKDPGCVRYGMKRIRISPRISYESAVNSFLTYLGHDLQNSTWKFRKFEPKLKSSLNGRRSTGVKILRFNWFENVECIEVPDLVSRILASRRTSMLEAAKIYCIDRKFCNKK